MTPIEAAVKAGRSQGFDGGGAYGLSRYAPFNETDARAIITAFLEAAAEDEGLRMKVVLAMDAALSMGASPGARAILVLKEAVNAG